MKSQNMMSRRKKKKKKKSNSTSNPKALRPGNSKKSSTKKWYSTSNRWLHLKSGWPPKRINMSDSEEKIVFNFKPDNTPQIQIIEATSDGNSEEFNDLDSTTSENENNDGHQLWDEESDEEIIYHILKKSHKGPETNNESEESLMINLGLGGGRDNSARPRPINEECSW
jgi:hypothetical protein